MPLLKPGGSGGGGGGLHFRNPADEFTGANLAACRTARDTYFNLAANAGAKAQFAADRSLAIILNPTNSADNTFETWIGSATDVSANALWVARTDAVRGAKGDTGSQARFLVYAWVNSAVAPTAVPTGGTFVQSTGVKTVPVGYTGAPVTPVLTERTYRTQAPVNPANDADSVNLVWTLPAESPEYDAAGIAEDAADRAEASAAEAAGDAALVTSYSGAVPIIENQPFESNNLAFTVVGWRDYDFIQCVVRDSNATEQIDRPAPQIPTAGLDTHGESRVPFNNNDELRVERTDASDVLTLNITGWSGHPTTADVLTIYGIRSGVEPGTGPGGTSETNLAVANRGATTLQVTSSTGTDATIPAATAALTGLQSAADKTKLDSITAGANPNVGVTFSAADKTVLDNAGGLMRFGTVDPVTADGNDRDVWINTMDGTLWTKAGGAWTNQYTFPSGGGTPDPGDHTRRTAIAAGAALTEAEVTAGTSSMTQVVTTPDSTDWPSGTLRTLYLGVPDDEDAITDVEEGGLSVFSGFEHYEDVNSAKIIVSGHQWVRSISTLDGELNASRSLTIVQ